MRSATYGAQAAGSAEPSALPESSAPLEALIDILPVADHHNDHRHGVILNRVDDALITGSYP